MRWMRKSFAALALLLPGAMRSPMPSAAQGSLRCTAELELEDPARTALRLELRTPGWRFLALERQAGVDPEYLAFGLGSAWCALGPLAPRGLLRELADPLGFSPASEVYAEPTGFRLDGTLQGACRRGLWLEPVPGHLGLFALHRNPDEAEPWLGGILGRGAPGLLQAGGVIRLRQPGWAEVQALALWSLPPAPESSAQEWLEERPGFPGGSLLHLGGSLRLEPPPGRLACCLLAAASGGGRVAPGLFALWKLDAEGGAWAAQGLLGASTADYRLPEGELYPGAWAAGLRLELRPRPALRLSGRWQYRVDRPPATPEADLPGTREGQLAARLEVPLPAGGRLEAGAEAEGRAKYAADGLVEESAGAGLELALGGKAGRIDLELRGGWKEGEVELRGQLGMGRRGVQVLAGAAGSMGGRAAASGFRWRPFGRLEVSGKDFLFWLSAGGGDSGGEVSLGWSAAQSLRKSPTGSTSRSRR
jgi:hypothetical protein